MSMALPHPGSSKNKMLVGLSKQFRNGFLDYCEPVDLALGDRLCEMDENYAFVYFPLNSYISLVAPINGQPPPEVGMIGREGMLGASLALGVLAAPLTGIVQGAGAALRMPASRFRKEFGSSPRFQRNINRFLYFLYVQTALTAACNCFHNVESRMARWLLMADDHIDSGDIHLTHQLLADMLGVQRSAVTLAAGSLQERSMITYSRGVVRITAREQLMNVACECYEIGRTNHRNMQS